MAQLNIGSLEHGDFDWSDGKRAQSLKRVYEEVLAKLDKAVSWYQTKRSSKRKLAWMFRVGAIVLGAVTAALPTASEMTRTTDGWLLRPGTATIIGIIVGTLLMLDKFIGASSAWIRFTMAETSLKELRDELTVAYSLELGQWAGQSDPSVDQTKHSLVTLQGYLSRVNQIVREETAQWKAEFQSALQQTEEFAKVPPKRVDEVLLIVKIANPERLQGPWKVSINGGPEEEGSDDSKAFRLTPGPVTVRIRAELKLAQGSGTRPYATELGDVLSVGAPKTLTVSLPPA